MTPYYQDSLCTIYHGDCRDVASFLSPGVVVTDPPYGMSYHSGRGANHDRIAGDATTEARDSALRALGVPNTPALVFGRWDMPRPANVRHRLIWSKGRDPGMGDLSFPWGNSDEEIYVIGNGFVAPRRQGNVLEYQKPPVNGRDHPTPKPQALMRHLIERCPPGLVIDPFMGSGTTLVAAKELGRKAIGIEIEEKYCEIAARRLSQETLFSVMERQSVERKLRAREGDE